MDLRRWGEFAFGLGVLMCGGAFLLLALERLDAPVVAGVPVSVPAVAPATERVAAAAPPAVTAASPAATAAPPAPSPARADAAAHRVAKIAPLRRPSIALRPAAPRAVAARPHESGTPIVAVAPTRPVLAPRTHAAAAPPRRRDAAAAAAAPPRRRDAGADAAASIAYPPAAKRSPAPRMLAAANRPRRSRVAVVRSPKSDRTPEPPIGYDDNPTLLRSDGPGEAMPSMEPVQVELKTTHLGH